MATNLTGSLTITSNMSFSNPNLLDTPTANPNVQLALKFSNGTGSGKATLLYYNQLSLVASTPQTLTISSLTDIAFNTTLNFCTNSVKYLCIFNLSQVSGQILTVGKAATHPFVSWLSGTTPGVIVGAGGCLVVASPIDGYASVITTSDQLEFDPGANTFGVDVIIVG